jgi:hypothetical protein
MVPQNTRLMITAVVMPRAALNSSSLMVVHSA